MTLALKDLCDAVGSYAARPLATRSLLLFCPCCVRERSSPEEAGLSGCCAGSCNGISAGLASCVSSRFPLHLILSMSAARPQPESSTVSRVLAGTTLALKVAREATDSVSIAKQILGSAAHISEFAEVR